MRIIFIIIWVILTIYLLVTKETTTYTVAAAAPLMEDIAVVLTRVPDNIVINTGAQNVHDSNVRKELWAKYDRLSADVLKTNTMKNLRRVALTSPVECRALTTVEKYDKMIKVVNNLKVNNTITNTRGDRQKEGDIYAVVYHKFKELKLPLNIFTDQIADCVDEDGDLLCITGRVSRYIGVFEGLTEDYLGHTEMTAEIMFQYALNRAHAILQQFLSENPEFQRVYAAQGTIEEERQLNEFLDVTRGSIHRQLNQEFPTLGNQRINEILEAI